ncbi:unnamed protein product [Pleuronectes platessa]|uniref:Uncharacterized protein n=1 Tax=Pleuronectes platessa TaxID=8262 RepID=A0A9N7Y735_PLEPL|nr:unnamed protein product [Pleuronectes platessa]
MWMKRRRWRIKEEEDGDEEEGTKSEKNRKEEKRRRTEDTSGLLVFPAFTITTPTNWRVWNPDPSPLGRVRHEVREISSDHDTCRCYCSETIFIISSRFPQRSYPEFCSGHSRGKQTLGVQ